jgi:hypothetical protein
MSRALACRALLAGVAPDATQLDRVIDPAAAERIDWEWVMDRAALHKVGALAAARLAQSSAAARLPPTAVAACAAQAHQAAERTAAARETLRELAANLRGAGIPFILLKGSTLAELVYGDAHLRPFYDVDIVVRRADLAAAEALLGSMGYAGETPWRVLGGPPAGPYDDSRARALARGFHLRVFHNLGYHPSRGDPRRPIELHWHIVPRGRLRVDESALWVHTRGVTVAGIELRALDAEATAIHLAVHALEPWFHGFRLLHLCDFAWSIAVAPPPADALWGRAASWGAVYHLELALRLADRLFDLSAARALLVERPPRRAVAAALRFASATRLIERRAGGTLAWPERAAIELAWGLAVRGMRPKLAYSIGRRITAARWRLECRRARAR